MAGLRIEQLSVSIENANVLKEINCTVAPGTVHAIMGANGSGKSSLAYTIMGHPAYTIESGTIIYNGHTISDLSPDKRAKLGIFLAFQTPYALPGVTVFAFLKEAYQAITGTLISVSDFQTKLFAAMELLAIDKTFATRSLNEGFSGGEKKRFELLQLMILDPSLVILDELDSGLDSDALKIVASNLLTLKTQKPSLSIILITHHQKILEYIKPDYVHVMIDGAIKHTGDSSLARVIEQKGYDEYRV